MSTLQNPFVALITTITNRWLDNARQYLSFPTERLLLNLSALSEEDAGLKAKKMAQAQAEFAILANQVPSTSPNLVVDLSQMAWTPYKRALKGAIAHNNNATLLAELRERMSSGLHELSDIDSGMPFYRTLSRPRLDHIPDSAWTPIVLDLSEPRKDTLNNALQSWLDDKGMTGEFLGEGIVVRSISAEILRLQVDRPWFDNSLFENRAWRHTTLILSDGAAKPTGALPAFIDSMLVARNVVLHLEHRPPSVEVARETAKPTVRSRRGDGAAEIALEAPRRVVQTANLSVSANAAQEEQTAQFKFNDARGTFNNADLRDSEPVADTGNLIALKRLPTQVVSTQFQQIQMRNFVELTRLKLPNQLQAMNDSFHLISVEDSNTDADADTGIQVGSSSFTFPTPVIFEARDDLIIGSPFLAATQSRIKVIQDKIAADKARIASLNDKIGILTNVINSLVAAGADPMGTRRAEKKREISRLEKEIGQLRAKIGLSESDLAKEALHFEEMLVQSKERADTQRNEANKPYILAFICEKLPMVPNPDLRLFGVSRLQRGDKGWAVRQLQLYLARAGFKCGTNGAFEFDTELAVRSFQQQQGLTVNGIVGANTLAALEARSQER